jgi:ribosomal protein S21
MVWNQKEKIMEVTIRDSNDDHEFDKAVKIFKKMIQKSGILEEVKDRRYYVKPSERKHLLKKTFRPKKDE